MTSTPDPHVEPDGSQFDFSPRAMPTLVNDVESLLARAHSGLGIRTEPLGGRFRAPLTMAVAGRTNAGKSTLVNALIGHRIAATRATECTRVITWYRFGAQETAQVVCTDGTKRRLSLTAGGTLPDQLGVPVDEVARIDVGRSYEPLRHLTVIDTPGLYGDEGLAAHTEQLLAGDEVDVLLYVFTDPLTDYEIEVLKKFRRRSRSMYSSPANVLGVLSRADQLGDEDHTWANAFAAAERTARERADQLSGVLPVIGRIAETTETGRFGETQASWLRTLAGLTIDEREQGLFDADEFGALDCDVPLHGRIELVDRLDMHGIRMMSRSVTANTPAARMLTELRAMSGIGELWNRIDTMFVRPATVHKTVRVLADLRRAAISAEFTAAQRDWLRDQIESTRRSRSMHVLDELYALAAIHSGRCELPADERERALAMFGHVDHRARLTTSAELVTELAAAAAEAERSWRTIANSAIDPRVSQVADTAAWSAALMREGWVDR